LPAVRLPGGVGAFDRGVVAWLARELGPNRIQSLLCSALTATVFGLASPRAERIVAGLLNCLPADVRAEFSFSTGLRFSPRRPFRWVVVDQDPVAQRHLQQQFDFTVVDPHRDGPPTGTPPDHGWASFVAACLTQRRWSALKAELNRPRPGLTTAELSALGAACCEQGPPIQRSAAATIMS
jgi:hypothetical protein